MEHKHKSRPMEPEDAARMAPPQPPLQMAPDRETLAHENQELRVRLQEAEETLAAIRSGEVEALVVDGAEGPRVFTLTSAAAASNRLRGEMLAQVSDAVVAVDLHGHLTFLNAAAEHQYGVRAAQVLGRTLDALYSAPAEESRAVLQALRERGEWRGESIHTTRDGRQLHVESSLTILRDGDTPTGTLAIVREVGDRKVAEERLRDSEERYRRLFDANPFPMWVFDVRSLRFLAVNEAAVEHYGFTREEFLRMSITDIRPADEIPRLEEMLRTTSLPRIMHSGGWRHRKKDGTLIDVELSAHAVDFAGVPARVVLVHDVTARERTRRALREQERRFRGIFDSTFQYIGLLEPDGSMLELNRTALDAMGLSADDAMGRKFWEAPWWERHPEDRARVRAAVARAAAGEFVRLEASYRPHEGGDATVDVSISPVRDENGEVVLLVPEGRDITSMKQAREELRLHREHLQQMVDERTAELEASHQRLRLSERMAAMGTLAAGLGHDMGNLLMPMRVRLETLELLGLPEAARKEVEGIRCTAEYLRKLAAGLRLLALDSSGSVDSGPTDLRGWWAETEAVIRNALPRNVTLNADLSACPQVRIAISRPGLTQAVFNLVQNAGDAMKAAGGGTATIACRIEPGSGGPGQLLLSVSDTGPGMPEDVKQRCMEPFFTTKARGVSTGLGLTLVYALVEEAGGNVELESAPGQGTRFTLRLGLHEQPALAQAKRRACIDLKDARLRGFVAAELKNLSFRVAFGVDAALEEDLVVVEEDARADLRGHLVRLRKGLRLGEVKALLLEATAAEAGRP